MRLALAFLLLPCAIQAQFFGNQQNNNPNNQQNSLRTGQNPSLGALDPYQVNRGPTNYQNGRPYGQPPNSPQADPGGIMRPNSAHVYNSQANQHPIFDLQNQQQNQNHQLQPRQDLPSRSQFQSNQQQQSQSQNSNQFNPNLNRQSSNQFNPNQQQQQQQSHLQSPNNAFQQQNPNQQSHLQSPNNAFQQQNSNQQNSNSNQQQPQQQGSFRPRAYNRLSNQINQWTGSNGHNSPGILTAPSRGQSTRFSNGATFYIQLTSYSNERLAMKGGNTCYCPREQCTLIENILHPCYFTFTVVVATASGEPVHYVSKQFVAVNSTGQPSPADGDWTVPVTLELVSKPTYIDIFVNNLGPVIQGTQVQYLDEFWQVDTFTIDMNDYTPSIANQQPTPVNTRLNGQLVGSNLEVSYYVQCQAGLLGDNCDLQCRPTKKQDPPRSICTSRVTNVSSVCGLDSNRAQVQNCQICGFGVVNDDCADAANLQGRELGVNSAFRVWTIVLGVLLGIAIIFIIILVFMYVIAERKLKNEHQRELNDRDRRYNGNGNGNGIGAYENGRNAISNPLLANDEWSKPAQPGAFIHHGVESESNHSDSPPRPAGMPSTSAFQPQQHRREAQV